MSFEVLDYSSFSGFFFSCSGSFCSTFNDYNRLHSGGLLIFNPLISFISKDIALCFSASGHLVTSNILVGGVPFWLTLPFINYFSVLSLLFIK